MTLATLRTRAKVLSDLVDSSKVTDAQWTEFLNDGVKTLYDILVSRHEYYFETTETVTIVTDQTDYDLPASFMRLLQLDYRQSSTDDYMPVFPWQNDQAVWLEGSIARIYWDGTQQIFYGLRGGKLRILPVPTSGNLRLRYIPMCPLLVDEDDDLPNQLMNQWDKFVLWSAVADAKSTMEDDAMFAQGKMQEMRQHIEKIALHRDVNKPRTIQNVNYNKGW